MRPRWGVRGLGVAAMVTLVASAGCSSSADERFGTPDVSVGPSADLTTSIDEFVSTRSLADVEDAGLRVPIPNYLSARCAGSRDVLAPVFEYARVRVVSLDLAGPRAVASYDIEVAIESTPGSTPPQLAPDGPPIEVRGEPWVLEGDVWLWDGC